jgi:hypothetical protein
MILLGVALEFGQKLVPGRAFEVRDMFINGFGVLTGIAIGIRVHTASPPMGVLFSDYKPGVNAAVLSRR